MSSYDTLAHYYDQLVKDEEATKSWVDWIESFQPRETFLELACGSGEITLQLAENHIVSAMDISEEMVEAAKAKDTENKIEFSVGDMRDLSNYQTYDAIGCFCDSFNYLLEDDDVEIFFKQVAGHLNPGGWFFFDTHSMDRLDEFADEYEEAGEFEDGTGLQWIISAEDDIIYQDFAFYFPDKTVQEHHMQRVYTPEYLEQELAKYFDIISIKTDFDQEGIQPGEKYFYAARLKQC